MAQGLGITPWDMPSRFFPRTTPYTLAPAIQQLAHLPFSVPALLQAGGTGMFTCFPSTTPFGFALGTD